MKKIFTSRIAFELRKMGFDIIKTEINPNHPQFDVYCFEETEEFNRALDNLLGQESKKRPKK